MTETITLLVPSLTPVPPEEIYELTGNDDLHVYATEDGELLRYEIIWEDVEVRIHLVSPEDSAARLLNVIDHAKKIAKKRDERKTKKFFRRLERTKQLMECEIDPEWDMDGKAEALIRGILSYFDYSFMFVDGAFYNENGNLRIGDDDAERKYFRSHDKESPLAAERKRQSIKHLEKEGVPTIEHLPVIVDENEVTIRSKEATLKRAIALLYVADIAAENTETALSDYMQQYQLTEDDFTPLEWDFLHDDEPEEYLIPYFAQRYESVNALLWALGFVSELGKPTTEADIATIRDTILSRSYETVSQEANMRSNIAILDTADRMYRYHWAVMDALLYDTPIPAGLNSIVAYERHYAMNWLIHYKNQAWEDVSTDT